MLWPTKQNIFVAAFGSIFFVFKNQGFKRRFVIDYAFVCYRLQQSELKADKSAFIYIYNIYMYTLHMCVCTITAMQSKRTSLQ